MLTENERKANNAHDELASLWAHLLHSGKPGLERIASRIEIIYDNMTPMFADILGKE